MTTVNDPALLEVENLIVQYRRRRKSPLTAVNGVSLGVQKGETVGVVGESGSGKSTLGNVVLGMTPVHSGTVNFEGEDITAASPSRRRHLSEHLAAVFQDPYSSLNPSRTIGQTLEEPLLLHRKLNRTETVKHIGDALGRVGLAESVAPRYPNAFSGGQRQRIAIARALMLSPKLVVCDEPVSALDLSVQAQVLNLFRELQREMSLSYLFISHDLEVVRHVCHRVAVMYRGHIVEDGPADWVCGRPSHPYTQVLLAAAPVPDPFEQSERRLARQALHKVAPAADASTGSATDPGPPGTGCPFVPRCPHAMDICRTVMPALEPSVGSSGVVKVACHWVQTTSSQ